MGTTLLALVGPTASGKTEAAIALADSLNAEIASVDSMLVYRGMDIGTAKPSAAQRAAVPHHLIDLADPSEPFSVARYQSLGRATLAGIEARGHATLLAGGSGLYFRALVDDLTFPGTDTGTRALLEDELRAVGPQRLHERLTAFDPLAASKIEPANERRTVRALEVAAISGRRFSEFAQRWDRYPPEGVRAAGLDVPREVLAERIRARVDRMLAAGWVEEVRGLVERGFGAWLTSTQAIGYAELALHLQGRNSLEEAVELTVKRTKNLARRQTAWFRRDPRIRWFSVGPEGPDAVLGDVRAYLESMS
jgi:tRNA dimethylallyltransferase